MSRVGGELGARARLLGELAAIARHADETAATRCPYRDARDRCTFRGGCRNRRPRQGVPGDGAVGSGPVVADRVVEWRCSGDRLRP